MKRILNAYGAKFRALLARVRARDVEQGMQWFFQRAEELSGGNRVGSEALEAVYQQVRKRVARFAARRGLQMEQWPVVFVCDAGLGGLARWLRAAGYMADWREGIGDAELIEEARLKSAVLLTTDSGMMERRILRDGKLPSLWLSPGLTKMQQLNSVLQELELPLLAPRCMECGGELQQVEKTAVAERIPPKTYRWRDEYFLCRSCGKLFWFGTHWNRIGQGLKNCSR
jgi:uncharacterized protein